MSVEAVKFNSGKGEWIHVERERIIGVTSQTRDHSKESGDHQDKKKKL